MEKMHRHLPGLLFLLFIATCSTSGIAQFQRQYGTALDEVFGKVVAHGSEYYVIGSTGSLNYHGTVSRLSSTGQHLWTRRLDMASQWNDAILMPSGNLLVVGHSLPLDASSQSLMGVINPSGQFVWLRSFNVPGRESFNRVAHNPMADNPAFPYYVLGFQNEPGGGTNWDDVVLLTLNEAGTIGWKKLYAGVFGSQDDEFVRDLEALPNGDLLLVGNIGSEGVIFRTDNTGTIYSAAGPESIQFTFTDVTPSGSNFLSVGFLYPDVSVLLIKFNEDLLPIWQVSLPELTAVRNVWTSGNSIYVSGSAMIDGLDRGVLLRFQDGAFWPTLEWMKYLEIDETSYTEGAAWQVSEDLMAFTDGRVRPDGFGDDCAFIAVSDLDMNTCMTQTTTTEVVAIDYSYYAPLPPNIDFTDAFPGMNQSATLVVWLEADACPVSPFSSISVQIYHDLDCDGTQDLLPNGVPIDTALATNWWFEAVNDATQESYTGITDAQGLLQFPGLTPGTYTVSYTLQTGWSPSAPAGGTTTLNVQAGEDALILFGACLSCDCDALEVVLTQEYINEDTSQYRLTILGGYGCLGRVDMIIESGELLDGESYFIGYDALIQEDSFSFIPIMAGNGYKEKLREAVCRVHASGVHSITITALMGHGVDQEQCLHEFTFISPPIAAPDINCCPADTNIEGPELVVNGDFDITSPGAGYTTDYTWTTNAVGDGNYSIMNQTQILSANGSYWHCIGKTGNVLDPFMVVDGSTISGEIVWAQNVNIAPATTYKFSVWANNIIPTTYDFADPVIQIRIVDAGNNVVASSSPTALPESPDEWQLLCLTWTSPVSASVSAFSLQVVSLATSQYGNDFALDCISFRRCVDCQTLPADAIAWWPMDEQGTGTELGSIDIVSNLSSTSLPGPIGFGGPNPVVGKVDVNGTGFGALEFVGPNPGSYLLVQNSPKINFGNTAFTIDAWVKSDMPTQTAPIVDKLVNQSAGYAFAITGNSSLAYPTLTIGTNNGVEVFYGPPVTVGQWNFVAVVVDPPMVTFYVGGDPGGSGVLATSTSTLTNVPNATNSLPMRIGGNPVNPHWQIVIDELEFFNRALKHTELDKIWAADSLGKCRETCPVECVVNSIDISTGANPLNPSAYLSPGGNDPQWMLIAAPPVSGITNLPQPANLTGSYPGWATPPSTWISATPFSNYGTNNCVPGPQDCSCPPFVYERRFCVCETSDATFNFDFYSDNNGSVELYREDLGNPGNYLFFASLADNCPNLNAATNFSQPLAVNSTLTLPPGRYALRINNWNISSGPMGVNLNGTISGLTLESDTCCALPLGSLCVTKYHDLDCNGVREVYPLLWSSNEPGLSNWTFQVAGPSGSFTGVTDQQGQVCFTDLLPGTYSVSEVLQPGWVPSNPAGGSTTVNVSAFSSTNASFGNCTDVCKCGPFSFLYSVGSGPLLPRNCGDVLYVPNTLPFQFIPSFVCNGDCTQSPTVDYVLTGPDNFPTQSMNGVPISSLPIVASTFTLPGTYNLIIFGHCDGIVCPCELTFIFPGDCCEDYQLFLSNVQSHVSVTIDNAICKASINIGNLPDCNYLEWVNWGDNSPLDQGPFGAGDMPMHTYATSGVYVISYLAIETDPLTGLICFEHEFQDSIFLMCADPCNCSGADNLSFVGLDTIVGSELPAFCGSQDTIIIPCDLVGSGTFWFHGDVHCTEDNCLQDSFTWSYTALPPIVGVSGSGVLSSNTGKDGHFDILLNYANFVPGTTYALSVTHYCGNNACTCTVLFRVESCDLCQCGMFDNVKLLNKTTGLNTNLSCANPQPVGLDCPPPGKPHKITGKLNCTPSSCKGSQLQWELIEQGTSNTVASGTQPGPWFSIALNNSVLAGLNGLYNLVLTGMCGNDVCTCTLPLDIAGCPATLQCPCDPVAFQQQVSAGFNAAYDYDSGMCQMVFTPAQVTECDVITWVVQGQTISFNATGTTTGNQPFWVTFPNALEDYQICMTVNRPGTNCNLTFCQTIKVNCLVLGGTGICENNSLDNSGFEINAVPGVLGEGGSSEGWNRRAGEPVIVEDDGCEEPFAIQLTGVCVPNLSDVIDRLIAPTPKNGLKVSVCYKIDPESWRPGTELVVRLSEEPQSSAECVECQVIARIPIPYPTNDEWQSGLAACTRERLEDFDRFTVHLENELTYDEPDARSMLLIDNICFEETDSSFLITTKEILHSLITLRIYPNPSSNVFNLELPWPAKLGTSIRLVDLTGRVLHQTEANVGSALQILNAGHLPGGMYFVQVWIDGRLTGVEKLVKQ